MSQLTREFESTGETAMYRKEGADYHTLRYVNWLEAKVENLQQTTNIVSLPCPKFRMDNECECELGFEESCIAKMPCVLSRQA